MPPVPVPGMKAIVEQARETDRDIEFLGKRAPEELAGIYGSSDVFVLPSLFEGLPLVLIEALACGCKAVMTDLPGIRPWVEGNIDATHAPQRPCDTSALSWDALVRRLLAATRGLA